MAWIFEKKDSFLKSRFILNPFKYKIAIQNQ